MPFLLPLLAAAAAVAEAALIYFAVRHRRRARFVAEAPGCKARELAEGPAKFEGRAVALAGTLEGPLSGKPCVYYRFVVQERRRQHHGKGSSTHWRTVIDDARHVPCGLEDESGIAAVNLAHAEFLLRPDQHTRSGTFNDAPPELERTLNERYGRSSKGWIFNKAMRYTETLIEEGDRLFVAGTVRPTEGGNAQFVRGDGLLLVADRCESEVLAHYRGYALLCTVLAVLLPAGALLLVLLTRP